MEEKGERELPSSPSISIIPEHENCETKPISAEVAEVVGVTART
jgi:hypothetical protein